MTLREIFTSAANLCGFAEPGTTPESFRAEALQMIHAALQLMQAGGEEYFARETVSVSLVTGQATYTLSPTVQTVLEQVRLPDTPSLRRLHDRSEFDSFPMVYLGTSLPPDGRPLAYYIETNRRVTPPVDTLVLSGGPTGTSGTYNLDGMNSGRPRWTKAGGTTMADSLYFDATVWRLTTGNTPASLASVIIESQSGADFLASLESAAESTNISLLLSPAPDDDDYPTLLVDVLSEAPKYTFAQVCDPTVIPPVPHRYHESILLPLVRYNMAGTRYFRAPEGSQLLQSIQADYSRALGLLGMSNPDRSPKSQSAEPQEAAS